MNEEKINEYILKLQGKVSLLKDLIVGHAFKVELDGAVDQTILEDNQDGTYNRLYRFRPITGKILYDDGAVTKTKDMRSRSQQLRSVLRQEWQRKNEPITEEDYYDAEMVKIIQERLARNQD